MQSGYGFVTVIVRRHDLRGWPSVVEDDIEQRTVHAERAIVTDEAELSKFVHKETDPRPSGPDHLGKRLLADIGNCRLRLAFFSKPCEQKQRARQPFFTGIKELIHEVLFDAHAVRQEVIRKKVREAGFLAEHLKHHLFRDAQDAGRFKRRRSGQPDCL